MIDVRWADVGMDGLSMKGRMLGWMTLWTPNCRALSQMQRNGMERHVNAWGNTHINLCLIADTGLVISLNNLLKPVLAKLPRVDKATLLTLKW